MNLTPRELFKAMNDRHENLKDCEGMIISPELWRAAGR